MAYRGYNLVKVVGSRMPNTAVSLVDFTKIKEYRMDCIHNNEIHRITVNNDTDYKFNFNECVQWLAKHYPEPEPEPVEVIITKPKTKYKPVRKVEQAYPACTNKLED